MEKTFVSEIITAKEIQENSGKYKTVLIKAAAILNMNFLDAILNKNN